MTDFSRPSVLHVIVRAGATNSQYNEHCLPMLEQRRITVCSLFPADVVPPPNLRLVEGDGTTRGCMRALRRALELDDYDIVHVHAPASGVLTLAAYVLGRRRRRNLVFTVHNSWENFRFRNRIFLRLILALYPTVIVCGNAARSSMPWLLRTLFRRKLHAVPNGVDVNRIDRVISEMGPTDPAPDGFVVLSVNRLIPLKDPGTVLQAFMRANRHSAELVLVGEGPLRERIKDAVLQSHLHRKVTLTGIVERDQVYRMLALGDAFMSASRGEGLPVAVLEAMACRCPVILSDIPPHREIAAVAPGIHLVPVGDVNGFARALQRLIALEPKERRALGEDQRQCVIDRFSVATMNESYGEIYMRVIDRHQPRLGPPHVVRTGASRPDDSDSGLLTRMRNRMRLVITLTVLGAALGLAYSQLAPPSYSASASLIVGDVIGGPADEDALKASASLAASYADLARREPVLKPVAEEGYASQWRLLLKQVHAQTGEKNPQLVQITASASSRDEAEGLAGAVADQIVLLTQARDIDEQAEYAQGQLERLEQQIVETQERIETIQQRMDLTAGPQNLAALQEREAAAVENLETLQETYDDIEGQVKSTATENAQVSILENAYAAPSPLRPDLVGLAGAGAGVGLALAAGLIYLQGQRRRPDDDRAPSGGSAPRVVTPHGPQPLRTQPWAEHEPTSTIEPTRRENKGR